MAHGQLKQWLGLRFASVVRGWTVVGVSRPQGLDAARPPPMPAAAHGPASAFPLVSPPAPAHLDCGLPRVPHRCQGPGRPGCSGGAGHRARRQRAAGGWAGWTKGLLAECRREQQVCRLHPPESPTLQYALLSPRQVTNSSDGRTLLTDARGQQAGVVGGPPPAVLDACGSAVYALDKVGGVGDPAEGADAWKLISFSRRPLSSLRPSIGVPGRAWCGSCGALMLLCCVHRAPAALLTPVPGPPRAGPDACRLPG